MSRNHIAMRKQQTYRCNYAKSLTAENGLMETMLTDDACPQEAKYVTELVNTSPVPHHYHCPFIISFNLPRCRVSYRILRWRGKTGL